MGLSHWDLMISVGAGLMVMAVIHPFIGIGFGLALAVFLKFVKEGKPRGYLWHLSYRLGLLSLLPDGLRPSGLVPPPPLVGPRLRRFSGVAGEADDTAAGARHYWSGKTGDTH